MGRLAQARDFLTENPVRTGVVGLGGLGVLGGGYAALRALQSPSNPTPSLTQLPMQEATQAPVSPAQPSAQRQQMIQQAGVERIRGQTSNQPEAKITPEDMMKERLRLMKEQKNLRTDVAINETYQKALGYDPTGEG